MLFASFALALNNVVLWLCPISDNNAVMMLWLLCFLLLQETFNTFFATPYSALCIDIAPDYNDQTKMQGYKTVFYIMGLILPSVLMYLFMPSAGYSGQGQFNRQGYINIATINSLLALVCGLITVFGTRKRVRSMPGYEKGIEIGKEQENLSNEENVAFLPDHSNDVIAQKSAKNSEKLEQVYKNHSRKRKKKGKSGGLSTILAGYIETFKKRDFRTVMLGYSVSLIATVFITSVGMHLFTFCYHFSSTQISILMICLFGGAIASQALWVNIVKKYDKKQTLIFALSVILFGIAMTSITFLFRLYCTSDRIFWFVMPCLFVCGVGSGALYSLPHSMYADVVTMEQYKTGVNNAGRYTGYYTFTYNFSNSIALLFIGVLLDLVKFDSSQPVQALSVQNGLAKIVFFGSAISLTIAIWIFSKYNIKRADVLKVQIKSNEGKISKSKNFSYKNEV